MKFYERVEYRQASIDAIHYILSQRDDAINDAEKSLVSPNDINAAAQVIAEQNGLDPDELAVEMAGLIFTTDPASSPEDAAIAFDQYSLAIDEEIKRKSLELINHRKNGLFSLPYRRDFHNRSTPLRTDPNQAPLLSRREDVKAEIEVDRQIDSSGTVIIGYRIVLENVPVYAYERELLAQAKGAPEDYRAVQLFLKKFDEGLQRYDSDLKLSGEINFTTSSMSKSFQEEGIVSHIQVNTVSVALVGGNEIKGLRINGEETSIRVSHDFIGEEYSLQVGERKFSTLPDDEEVILGTIDWIASQALIQIDPVGLVTALNPAALTVSAGLALGKVIIKASAKKISSKILVSMAGAGSPRVLSNRVVSIGREIADETGDVVRINGRVVSSIQPIRDTLGTAKYIDRLRRGGAKHDFNLNIVNPRFRPSFDKGSSARIKVKASVRYDDGAIKLDLKMPDGSDLSDHLYGEEIAKAVKDALRRLRPAGVSVADSSKVAHATRGGIRVIPNKGYRVTAGTKTFEPPKDCTVRIEVDDRLILPSHLSSSKEEIENTILKIFAGQD